MAWSLGVEKTTQFSVNKSLPNGIAQLGQQLEQLLLSVFGHSHLHALAAPSVSTRGIF